MPCAIVAVQLMPFPESKKILKDEESVAFPCADPETFVGVGFFLVGERRNDPNTTESGPLSARLACR